MEITGFQVMPPLSDAEYEELKADIAKRGVMVPIEYDEDGNVLDGHHRIRACQELGLTIWPRLIRQGMTDDEKRAHALMLNLARRHLTNEQRKPLWVEMRKSGMTLEAIAKADGTVSRNTIRSALDDVKIDNIPPTITDTKGRKQPTKKPRKTKTVFVSTEVAEKAETLPEAYKEAVLSGERKPSDAIREIKRVEIVSRLDEIKRQEVQSPTGLYDVIVIDPPWPIQKIERDERPNQSEFDYPTMTEEEIAAINLPMADDCHVFLWTTQKYLPMAFRIMTEWNLKYVYTHVWHKPGGFQPFGLPQYNCEFCLYGKYGSPVFIDTKDFSACFEAPRKGHSEKPNEFYETVCRVTGGRRLDMFNRRRIDGFDGFGNESNH